MFGEVDDVMVVAHCMEMFPQFVFAAGATASDADKGTTDIMSFVFFATKVLSVYWKRINQGLVLKKNMPNFEHPSEDH